MTTTHTICKFAIAATLSMSFAIPAFSSDLPKTQRVETSGKLTILNTLAYAPFNFYDENQKPAGLVIELAQAAADALDAKLDVVVTPFPSIFPSIAAGRSDIAWSTFTATAERLNAVDFVTFMKSGIVAVVPTTTLDQYKSQNDLCGKKIAVYAGNSADFAADSISADCEKANLPKINKMLFPTQQESIQAVLSGRAEGRLEDSTAALYYVGTTNKAMAVAPGEYFPLPLGAIVKKGDTQTAEMLRSVIQHLMDNGKYAEILKKYNMDRAAIAKSEVVTSIEQTKQ